MSESRGNFGRQGCEVGVISGKLQSARALGIDAEENLLVIVHDITTSIRTLTAPGRRKTSGQERKSRR